MAGVGGALAGCSTAAVPYGANQAGVITQGSPAGQDSTHAAPRDTVLGAAREIPVGGGTIFTGKLVVVTQPTRGQYRAFSAVCTHLGCILNQVTGGTIDCPCHGSKFSITSGAVVAGPAPTPLPRKRIGIVNGMIVLS